MGLERHSKQFPCKNYDQVDSYKSTAHYAERSTGNHKKDFETGQLLSQMLSVIMAEWLLFLLIRK